MKYCIWNNKGGVGKSFLTFVLSTEYAIQNPNEIVVVADMCPQSNVSEMLLGGNDLGEDNLAKLAEDGITISGYIRERYLGSKLEKTGTELQYIVTTSNYNQNMPSNLFLLPGDFELDLFSAFVSRLATEPFKVAKVRAMSLLKDVLNSYEKSKKGKKVTFFIDCNPSFAVYTELAIFASNRLIVPCTGDHASKRGVNNVLRILYGINDRTGDSIFDIVNFSEKARMMKLNLPTPFLGVINKFKVFDQKATSAYQSHVKEIENLFDSIKDAENEIGFSFESVPVVKIKDCNNLSLIANYNGMPISKLEHKEYKVHNDDSHANKTQIDAMIDDVMPVIGMLGE